MRRADAPAPGRARAGGAHARERRFDRLLGASLVALSAALWALVDETHTLAAWPTPVHGLAFSPYARAQDPAAGTFPESRSLAADLDSVAPVARELRLYSLDGTLADVPGLAAERGVAITAGIPLAAEPELDARRLERLGRAARASANVRRAIVGNETLLAGRLDPPALARALDAARAVLPIPVSTAEPWHVWLRHRELARHVDFITVHLLPYWEGVHVDRAVDFIAERMAELRAAFPGRPIVIGEVGWPSAGRTRGDAEASPAAQARFLARFLEYARTAGEEYFLMEAFDQPWKRRDEGHVGAHWGLFDAARVPKPLHDTTLHTLPGWPGVALGGAALSLLLFWVLVRDGRRLGRPGRAFLAVAAGLAGNGAAWLVLEQLDPYWGTASLAVGIAVGVAAAGAALVALVEVHEWAEARWARGAAPLRVPDDARLPLVSVHLPISNEPPRMVIDTLGALAGLDYPRLEVLVVDNNTRDPARWRPVQAQCARLGERFRFFHVERLSGFKAGALNYALARTRPEAEVIAVIDADYRVAPGWLRRCVRFFTDPRVDLVQAPQDYRDGQRSAFKASCHAEYRGFFHIGMVTRDARNAIIQHGTMSLVRRSALVAAGGWGEWTITEDAELGLRLLARGGRAVYVRESQGRGLTPDNFADYKRQRLRWALGAVQILRRHARMLAGRSAADRGPRLTRGQRYHFVAGWVPWLADGASLLFAIGALLWSGLMLAAPGTTDPPPLSLSAIPIALFVLRTAKHLHLYATRVPAGVLGTLGAMLAGWALMPTAGLAVWMGLAGLPRGFVPTPKLTAAHTPLGALAAAGPETCAALGLLGLAVALGAPALPAGPDLSVWRVALIVMSVPFTSALALSALSAWPQRRRTPRAAPGPARAWASRSGDGD